VKRRGSAVRASRLARPTDQVDRGAPLAERHDVTYWCAADHHTAVTFSLDAETPSAWDCGRCGGPASPARGTAPIPTRPLWFPRTPYEFLMMRRTPEEGEILLAEALAARQSARLRRRPH
jgi:hypothetical protein